MRPSEQRSLVIVVLTVITGVALIGSAPRWATGLSCALAVLSILPLVNSRRELSFAHPLLCILLLGLGATVLQLLPLPGGLVALLSPARHGAELANAKAYGADPASFLPLSFNVPAGLVELAKLAGYLALAYACLRLSAQRRGRALLLVAVSVVGALVALCALGHRVVGATSLFGIYTPEVAYPQALSPFLNPNHLAGYTAMAVPLSMGVAVQRRSPWFGAIALLCAVTSLQAVSRGGALALVVGVVVCLFFLAHARQEGSRSEGASWAMRYAMPAALGLGFVGVVVAFATAGGDLLHLSLEHENEAGKLLAWRSAPDLMNGAWLTGIGRGAFESVFPSVQPPIRVTFSHIENEYLQVLLDWGLFVSLAMGALFLWLAHRIWRERPSDALAAGAIGALCGVMVQSSVDFALELPGFAFSVIVVVSTLVPGTLRGRQRRSAPRHLVVGRLTAAAIGIALCLVSLSGAASSARERLAREPAAGGGLGNSKVAVLAEARALSWRFPGDFQVPAAAALSLWRLQDNAAFAALSRALELGGNHSGVHFLAGRLLADSQSPGQALAEYREALRLPGRKREIFQDLVARFPASEHIVEAIPADSRSRITAAKLLRSMGRSDALSLLAQAATAEGERAIEFLELASAAAAKEQAIKDSVAYARMAEDEFESSRSALLLSLALERDGKLSEAITLLVRALRERSPEKDIEIKMLKELVSLQMADGQLEAAGQTGERLLIAATGDTAHTRSAHLLLSTIENKKGNLHRARWHKRRAESLVNR